MTTVSSPPEIYWGTGGEHGPFPIQTEGEWAGWPDFGKVMHHFLKKYKISIEEFAEMYGRKTKADHTPISKRQVEYMIYSNQVPEAITRRKIIADLLNIPYNLFGVAVLTEMTLQPHPTGTHSATSQTIRITCDTSKYQSNIRKLVTLHYTSQIQRDLDQINNDIQDLESLENQARGDLLYHIRELLFSYHLLAEKVTRDQQRYEWSHYYANQAVRVALATNDTDLIATARYTRGRTYFAWGRNGTLVNGVLQVQIDKIQKAIRDFQDAKKVASSAEKKIHPQLEGLISIYLSRAYAIHSASQGELVHPLVLALLDEAGENVGKESIDDPYQSTLVTGSPIGFVEGEYRNGRVIVLTIAGTPDAALTEIGTLKGLRQGAIGKDITRKQIWLSLVEADTYMAIRQYKQAIIQATNTLLACQDIHSIEAFTRVVDIHGRLLRSPYKTDPNVRELGDMIHETITYNLKQEEIHPTEEKDY